MRRTGFARAAQAVAVMALLAVLLLAALEGATRLVLRVTTGRWPRTVAAEIDDGRRATSVLYRRHPYLLTAAREGARDPREDRIVINSLGYRSPERPRPKPRFVQRVVCAGGSTTWDPFAVTNDAAWPSQVEQGLRARGTAAEVWNAGFPGWTSLENLIALSLRDVDLSPDVVVLYQGINDLQPAAHVPVEPDYTPFHSDMQLSLLGLGVPPLPWYERLVMVERAHDALFGPRGGWLTGRPQSAETVRRVVHADGVRVFERNVRSFVAVARAHGARVLLVTQHLHVVKERHRNMDGLFQFAFPDLDPESAVRQLARLNDVLRAIAATGDADLFDADRDVRWNTNDFVDTMHTSGRGSRKLAEALVEPVARVLASH
jgi:lysophospholipase L1-like esterase